MAHSDITRPRIWGVLVSCRIGIAHGREGDGAEADHHQCGRGQPQGRHEGRGQHGGSKQQRGQNHGMERRRLAAGRDQAADHCAHSQGRRQGRVAGGSAVESELRDHGKADLELVGQRADDGHDDQHVAQHRGGPDVAQPGNHLAARVGQPYRGVQFARPHDQQHDHHCDVRQAVNEKTRRQADGRDQDAGDGRADDARQVNQAGKERDRVLQLAFADHFHHERLAGRVVDDIDQAKAEGQRGHHPEAHHAGRHQRAQDQSQDGQKLTG